VYACLPQEWPNFQKYRIDGSQWCEQGQWRQGQGQRHDLQVQGHKLPLEAASVYYWNDLLCYTMDTVCKCYHKREQLYIEECLKFKFNWTLRNTLWSRKIRLTVRVRKSPRPRTWSQGARTRPQPSRPTTYDLKVKATKLGFKAKVMANDLHHWWLTSDDHINAFNNCTYDGVSNILKFPYLLLSWYKVHPFAQLKRISLVIIDPKY